MLTREATASLITTVGRRTQSWQASPPGPLSVTMAELNQQGRVTQGKLQEEVPALFVTGVTDASRAVTDILSVRNGELTNVVLSDLTGVSGEIAPFCSLYPSDINNDGLTEVPSPIQVSSMMETGAAYQRVDWYAYNAGGQSSLALHTYHDVEDRWYLRLPEEWLNHIWVGRATMTDEAAVTFYILDGEAMEPFLRITAITGSSRENRACGADGSCSATVGGHLYGRAFRCQRYLAIRRNCG